MKNDLNPVEATIKRQMTAMVKIEF